MRSGDKGRSLDLGFSDNPMGRYCCSHIHSGCTWRTSSLFGDRIGLLRFLSFFSRDCFSLRSRSGKFCLRASSNT